MLKEILRPSAAIASDCPTNSSDASTDSNHPSLVQASLIESINTARTPKLAFADRMDALRDMSSAVTKSGGGVANAGLGQVPRRLPISPLDIVDFVTAVTGIFDPTPISDGIGAVVSLFNGDFLGAGASVISILPGGDLVGKPVKFLKFIEKISPAAAKVFEGLGDFEKIKKFLGKVINNLPEGFVDMVTRNPEQAFNLLKRALDGVAISTNLASKHAKTLDAIFRSSRDLKWQDVEALVKACGGRLIEGSGSRVKIFLNGTELSLHKPHGSNSVIIGAVGDLKKQFKAAGITP